MTDVADEIKTWRRTLGWTQEQAAEALDVPVQTIRAWEINRYPPRHRRVLTLAHWRRSRQSGGSLAAGAHDEERSTD
jgi:DNA-binding XRE family transcriptional regulator